MNKKKEAATIEEIAADATPDVHPDLKALVREVKRRDRQTVVARVLVEEFAKADGIEPDAAWLRHRRSLEIDRIAAMSKGDLRKTDVPALVAEVEARAKG